MAWTYVDITNGTTSDAGSQVNALAADIKTWGGNVDGNSFLLQNLAAPSASGDAARKGYVDTATAGKQDTITGAATTITSVDLTIDRALISNGSGKVAVSAVTATELGYLSGVSAALQTQLDAKQATITGAATTIDDADLTIDRALISSGAGKVAVSAVTATELGYVGGVTSAIQTQLDAKATADTNCRVAIKKNGTLVATRRGINLIEGTNVTLTVADDSGNEEVDVTITAAGGGGSSITRNVQLFTGSAVATLTLAAAPINQAHVIVHIGATFQLPGTSWTLDGSDIDFSFTLDASSTVTVEYWTSA